MGVKQQFDSSSGKAKFEPTPKKAMTFETKMASECAHCTDEQPIFVDVILSEWVDCACCTTAGPAGHYYESENNQLNDTYRVPHSAGCVYTKKFTGSPGDYGFYTHWFPAGACAGEPTDNIQWAKLEITVTAGDGLASVLLKRFTADEGDWDWPFGDEPDGIKDITYTGDDVCLDTDNCAEFTPGVSCCTNGAFAHRGPSGKACLAIP